MDPKFQLYQYPVLGRRRGSGRSRCHLAGRCGGTQGAGRTTSITTPGNISVQMINMHLRLMDLLIKG